MKATRLFFHDDGCGETILDQQTHFCPKCQLNPDTQSKGIFIMCPFCVNTRCRPAVVDKSKWECPTCKRLLD